jgi:hypothetical protein
MPNAWCAAKISGEYAISAFSSIQTFQLLARWRLGGSDQGAIAGRHQFLNVFGSLDLRLSNRESFLSLDRVVLEFEPIIHSSNSFTLPPPTVEEYRDQLAREANEKFSGIAGRIDNFSIVTHNAFNVKPCLARLISQD